MFDFFDFDTPFYKPLWLRLVLTLVMIGWGGLELAVGSPFWGTIFLIGGLYLGYRLFITFDPDAGAEPAPEAKDED